MLTITRHWSMDFPGEWMDRLRELSPISARVPWLMPRWFPMLREENGKKGDAGRWILYESVPMQTLPISQRIEMRNLLGGVPPSLMDTSSESARRRKAVRMMFADDWQCEMYRTYDVWARVLWIIQGDAGGHAVEYEEAEQQLLQLHGLPTDPPAVGELDYAPFDERVCRQMIQRNRLITLGNDLDALKKSGSAQAMKEEWSASQRDYRRKYMEFLTQQTAASTEFLVDYSRTMDCRNTIPEMSMAQRNFLARDAETYIEHGDTPMLG
jgi:hypothetical protein